MARKFAGANTRTSFLILFTKSVCSHELSDVMVNSTTPFMPRAHSHSVQRGPNTETTDATIPSPDAFASFVSFQTPNYSVNATRKWRQFVLFVLVRCLLNVQIRFSTSPHIQYCPLPSYIPQSMSRRVGQTQRNMNHSHEAPAPLDVPRKQLPRFEIRW